MRPLSAGGRLADRGGCGQGAVITLNQMKITPLFVWGVQFEPIFLFNSGGSSSQFTNHYRPYNNVQNEINQKSIVFCFVKIILVKKFG